MNKVKNLAKKSLAVILLFTAILLFYLINPELNLRLLKIGIILGSVYSLASSGLSLIYGVRKIMNLAHGHFLILAAYLALTLNVLYTIDILFSIPIILGIFTLIGATVYLLFIKPVYKTGLEPSITMTFGLLIFIETLMILIWTADVRIIRTPYSSMYITIGGEPIISIMELLTIVAALVMFIVLSLFLNKSDLGRAIRAVSQDWEAAEFSGIDVERIQLITFMIGLSLAGLGGIFYGVLFSFTPSTGITLLLISFVSIILGGIGSLMGTFVAAMLIALIRSFSAFYLGTQVGDIMTFITFLLILVLRPKGLMGRIV